MWTVTMFIAKKDAKQYEIQGTKTSETFDTLYAAKYGFHKCIELLLHPAGMVRGQTTISDEDGKEIAVFKTLINL